MIPFAMRRHQVVGAGILAVLVTGLALYVSSHRALPEGLEPTGEPVATTPGLPSTPPGAREADGGPAAALPELPGRELLTPVPRSHYDGGLRSVADLAEVKLPKDRRRNPGPRAQQELEVLGYAFETLSEDVEDCLAQWDALDAGATGEVMLVFQIDKDGLQKSWVDSVVELPFGPKSCIANAVYGLDWAHVVDAPAEVSQRFELSRDAGR